MHPIRFPEDAWTFARNWVAAARDAERYAEGLTENWPDFAELKRCQRQIDAAWVSAAIQLIAWGLNRP